jgi:hypothetical protein
MEMLFRGEQKPRAFIAGLSNQKYTKRINSKGTHVPDTDPTDLGKTAASKDHWTIFPQ